MKSFAVFATIALLSLPALAITKNTYKLETKLSLNDKPQYDSMMVITEGEKSSFSSGKDKEENFYDVIATEDSSHVKDGIKVQMEIGKIDEKGQRVVLARPTMITTSGEAVTITSGKGEDKVHIEIKPVRN